MYTHLNKNLQDSRKICRFADAHCQIPMDLISAVRFKGGGGSTMVQRGICLRKFFKILTNTHKNNSKIMYEECPESKFRSRIPAAQVAWAECACAVMSQEPRNLHQTHFQFSFFVYKFVILSWNEYENLVSCEIWSVIKFLNVKNIRPAEIYRQVCEVYG
jgi:hypothetical protein